MKDLLGMQEMQVADFLKECKSIAGRKPGLTYVIDQRHSNERFLVASLPGSSSWFEIPTAAIQSLTPLQPVYRDDLEGVLCRVTFGEQFDSLPPALQGAPNVRLGVDTLTQGGSTELSGSEPHTGGTSLVESPAPPTTLAWRTFSWNPMYAGDCQMHNARITFYSNGTGYFSSTVLTQHTHFGDYWHIRIEAKNQAGFVLFSLPAWTGPRMDDGNPPPHYPFNRSFGYNQTFLPAISYCTAYNSC